ncbi:MAG: hypothetical protein HKN74_07690 [Acidimicrobiia bacterium]|nr:hypothetical protein [Acidimicrobiia bacterium]NNF10149.1 hypothetical protein [Acidimicrobiia bacterium]NNL70571.1 hypothetical protein [Acidimicrobiia bacterium]
MRQRLVQAMLALYFALAPSTVPMWRLRVGAPPAATLVVGKPVSRIGS